MNIIPGDVIIEPATNRPVPRSQPVEALQGLLPLMDDAAVRQAIGEAEAKNLDPQSLTLEDFAQGQLRNPTPETSGTEVPQKFLKSDGAVDVEKIQASTKQLDEAIKTKETAITKTVDDYMREYQERETKFRTMPNPDRLATQLVSSPPPSSSPPPEIAAPQNFEEVVRRDYALDPLGTTTRLLDLMIQKKLQPMEEREKAEATRLNLQALASRDARILREDVFAAVNAKLQSDPDLWRLKNPHKAAWLEVKEEMRLGEPSSVPAQPSRASPVLSGGTPPSAPSSSVMSPTDVIANLHKLDLRDKKQEALGDEAIRAQLASSRG